MALPSLMAAKIKYCNGGVGFVKPISREPGAVGNFVAKNPDQEYLPLSHEVKTWYWFGSEPSTLCDLVTSWQNFPIKIICH
jgi:hypothetical protein